MKRSLKKITVVSLLFSLAGVIYFTSTIFKKSSPVEHLVWQCSIADYDGNLIRKYPCGQCLFRDNGEIVMQCQNDRLRYLSAQGEALWELPLHVHHMFNWNRSQTEILALSSEVAQEHGESVRYDVLLTINTQGKFTRRFSFWEHRKEIEKELSSDPRSQDVIGTTDENIFKEVPARLEASHANSFYEIGNNVLERLHPAFVSGNFIVNVNHLRRIFIIDKELKKILFSIRLPYKHNIHDAQITPSGHLLVFNNRPFQDDVRASIEVWDLLEGKLLRRYLGDGKHPFVSKTQGGVRLLKDDRTVFSNNAGNVFYLDSKMNLVRTIKVDFVGKSLQGIDVRDVSKFLKENKTL